jgi:hypothetical protein
MRLVSLLVNRLKKKLIGIYSLGAYRIPTMLSYSRTNGAVLF